MKSVSIEPRIAPASVLVTCIDIDGDLQQIDKLKIGRHVVLLSADPGNNEEPFRNDVQLFEVSEPSSLIVKSDIGK